MEPIPRIELGTSPLPRECSTAELYGRKSNYEFPGSCDELLLGKFTHILFLAVRSSPLSPRLPSLAALQVNLERVMGIEPTYSAWKAEVLPLNYTRKSHGPSYEWRGM